MALTVHRTADPAALAATAASDIASAIAAASARTGQCRLALAGGSTPRPLYARWAADPAIDWARVSLFWGDERCVPPDHPASNFRVADEALLRRLPVAPAGVHRMPGELPPEEAAASYERTLGDEPLDIVLLGIGDDGHTASLFPGGVELSARTRVATSRAPRPPHARVTLTLRALAEARAVFFLVSGSAKAQRVADVFAEIRAGNPRLPAARVRPASGVLHWYLDAAAARRLGRNPTGAERA